MSIECERTYKTSDSNNVMIYSHRKYLLYEVVEASEYLRALFLQ